MKNRNIEAEAIAAMKKLGTSPIEGDILSAHVFREGYELTVLYASGNELEEARYTYIVNVNRREVLESHCGTAPNSIATEWERIA